MTKNKKLLISVIVVAVALNAVIFCFVYPEAFKLPASASIAMDFSAYYIGGWRLFHNPTNIYYGGIVPHEYPIPPRPQTFKYTPSFLVFVTPFLSLSYPNALASFDLIQIALIPALAFFVYKIIKDKNLVVGTIAAVIVLIDPLPPLPLNQSALNLLGFRFTTLSAQTFSSSYYLGYLLGNAHVLQTVLLVGALYFGFAKRPWLSALFFAFGVFDPRAALFALPLILWYNRQKILQFISGAAVFLAVTNLPFFFYYNIGFTFLQQEVKGSIISQLYGYDSIPIYAVSALTIAEIISVISRKPKISFRFPKITKTKLETPKK